MKKLIAMVLVLTLVLSMGALAFAVEGNPYVDTNKIEVKKEVVLKNGGTVHPAEIFNFTIGAGVVNEGNAESAPHFDSNEVEISIAQDGLIGSSNIDLPEFEHVGVYTYTITEEVGNTAGFGYNVGPNDLKITVINNENYDPDVEGSQKFLRVLTLTSYDNEGNPIKLDAFKNDFSAGDLIINKEITGNYAVFTDEFEVTVELDPPTDKEIKEGPIAVAGSVESKVTSIVKNEDGTVTITFWVTHGSEVEIKNIPYDVSYTVTEESGDYDPTITGGSGIITESSQTVEIVNHKETGINTGINLDNLPYVLILVGAAAGLVAFTIKRRPSSDE